MTRFMGTHKGKLDKKGRISVPAGFRAVLEEIGSADIVLFPSFKFPCIEVWPRARFDAMSEGHGKLDIFSDEADALGAALFASAHPARPDGEGRLVLPEDMIAETGLGEAISFVGANRCFQIWDTEAALRRIREARLRARDGGLTIPAAPEGGAA